MEHSQVVIAIVLVLLIFLSAFFSAAETGLMAINRYRLRHLVRKKRGNAVLVSELLKRPDRLLGMILIGNNCANIFASALATLLALQLFGEKAVLISSALLTVAILIIAEVTPKTLAALYPDRISHWVAYPIYGLLLVFYPVVWLLNSISNGLLRILGVKLTGQEIELTREELRTLVYETAGRISTQYQSMLLGILDLNKETVEDVMVPSHEINSIDLDAEWSVIQKQISQSQHDWIPVYRDNINQILGLLHLRDLIPLSMASESVTKEKIIELLKEPYFTPESTPLNIQLLNFQREGKHLALVVDEYGELLGLVTMVDILEEIVGEFETTIHKDKVIEKQADGSFLVDGGITLRELNRLTKFKFSLKGPRTLNGLITEHLEMIPKGNICVMIANYPIEIVEVKRNRVKMARVFGKIKHISG